MDGWMDGGRVDGWMYVGRYVCVYVCMMNGLQSIKVSVELTAYEFDYHAPDRHRRHREKKGRGVLGSLNSYYDTKWLPREDTAEREREMATAVTTLLQTCKESKRR